MQNDNKQSRENLALPRRSRYYQSMMDIDAIDKVPNDLKAFFRYTVSKEVTDDLTKEIDSKLDTCRTNEAWRAKYMYWNLLEQDAKAAGREEGREEERAKTAQAILERDDALSEVARLKELLTKNGITVE